MAATQAVPRLAGAAAKGASWHRRRLLAAIFGSAALIVLLTAYGLDYYTLDAVHRISSAKHTRLRPSGSVGHGLGILGGFLFLLIFLYPIRKRWSWLSRKGKTKHWLDFHILMGLIAPAIITFHSSFKLHGIAGLAYWIMLSVVLSGIAGRYFYAQIPRRLDAAEMSLQEIQALSEQIAAQPRSSDLLPGGEAASLLRLPSIKEVQTLPLARAVLMMVVLDLKRPLLIWRLKREARLHGADKQELREAVATMRRQAALSKKILFLSKAQQIFHLWHVVHRPFSYSFAILSALHVLITVLLGYY